MIKQKELMTIQDMWMMNPRKFNSWRKSNDLKQLVKSFNQALPDFKTWKKEFKIKDEHLIEVSNIGEFFRDNEKKIIYKNDEKSIDEKYSIIFPTTKDIRDVKKNLKNEGNEFLEFIPYLHWAKARRSWNKLVDDDPDNCLDRFTYTLGNNAPDSPNLCHWQFVTGVQVLKLGGVAIGRNIDINNRNLDFVNLDHLKITGEYHGNVQLVISFSHIDNVVIEDANWRSVAFVNCHIFNLKIKNSKLSNFVFIDCLLSGIYSENSNLQSFHFKDSSLNNLTFINTSLDNVNYIAPKRMWFERKVETLNSNVSTLNELKLAFQANGNVEEARKIFNREKFARLQLEMNKCISFRGFWNNFFNFRFSRNFYTLKSNFISLIKGLALAVPFVFWDFGRKPFLPFLHWFLITIFFSLIYYSVSWSNTFGDYPQSFFTSVKCILRIGLNIDDIESNMMKLTIAIQSMISLFFIPIIVAGFLNKSKY